MTNVTVGSYQVVMQRPETSGSFLSTTEKLLKDAWGAFQFMNVVKKTALVCGNTSLAATVSGYTGLTSTPYFCSLVSGYVKTFLYSEKSIGQMARQNASFYGAMDFGHNVSEFCAMGLFSASMFDPMNKTIGNVATVFDAMADMFDVPTYLMDLIETHTVSNLAKEMNVSKDVQSGLTSRLHHSVFKLAKAVCASVTGFFSSYTVVYGAALVSAATALAFSSFATMFNVVDYYHQNWLSDHVAKDIVLVS